MKFEQALPALRDEKKVALSDWSFGTYLFVRGGELLQHRGDGHCELYKRLISVVLRDDWEIIRVIAVADAKVNE